jgi:hypothetical protein
VIVIKEEIRYALENLKDEDKIKSFLERQSHDSLYYIFTMLEYTDVETSNLWTNTYNSLFK